MQNKFLFYLMGLLFISFNSFAKAQETFSGGQGIYPNILLNDLQLDKISGSKISFRFKVLNQTKNSFSLEDIQMIIEKGVPVINTNVINPAIPDYFRNDDIPKKLMVAVITKEQSLVNKIINICFI